MATITRHAISDRKQDTDTVRVPRLENGDRLTRPEFERRYEAMPELKKAELIEGVVYIPSSFGQYSRAHSRSNIAGWIGTFSAYTPGVDGSVNPSVRMDWDNEPQPDVALIIDPKLGGQAKISEDDFLEGAPELVAEVASSSVSYDLHAKLHVYRRSGVREYLVWRVLDGQIDWFVLREGQYEPLAPGADGILKSTVFAGLWLDPAALLRGDLASVLAVLDQGVRSPEHAEFVARLAKSAIEPGRPEQERPATP